jgi:hypothetical protein
MRSLRLIDQAGQFVRALTDEEADAFLASGKAKMRRTGRRALLVLCSSLTVAFFDRGSEDGIGPALKATYTETHGSRRVIQLKRPSKSGELTRWDNDLTFEELRAGRMISETTRRRMAAAEAARKNLCLAIDRPAVAA